MRLCSLFIYVFGFALSCNSQSNFYTIEGTVKNVKTGKIFLVANSSEKDYYKNNPILDSAKITNFNFRIKRIKHDNEVYAYRCIIRSEDLSGTTDIILISSRNQSIIIDSIDLHTAPIISEDFSQTEIRYEYNTLFKNFVKDVNEFNKHQDEQYLKYVEIPLDIQKSFDSTRRIFKHRSDSLFILYAAAHRSSYVTFWKLIEKFENLGYKKEYTDIFYSLSPELRNSYVGKLFSAKLILASALAYGKIFPNLQLRNLFDEESFLEPGQSRSHFTLIDFWFSNCAPCISQFADFKNLYTQFGLEYIQIKAISTDQKINIPNWKKIISTMSLGWKHYLDEGGEIASSLGITSFPTNFLLNESGIIIRTNVTPLELRSILDSVAISRTFDKIETIEPQ